ncbi:MAG: dienelactone hydrolase family protein [Phycisphaerales bacterium]|nr:dienelactone hydrolase family protein [Phycisphaerales bacterium]
MAVHTPPPFLEVSIPAEGITLPGRLDVPAPSAGLVLFAHGSGSSRLSPRNIAVATALNDAGLATLLFDLLTTAEARDRDNVFDVEHLARRLLAAVRWAASYPAAMDLPVGVFGASTGAAAALIAAAQEPAIRAVVSRGGRPDLASPCLERVTAPTLLIVGGDDEPVLHLNEVAFGQLAGIKQLSIISGATHLFEEPGTLLQAASLASAWFCRYLRPDSPT